MRTFKHGFSITPSNSNPLTIPCQQLYVGGGGNVNVVLWGDWDAGANSYSNTLFVALPAGATLDVKVYKVWATGTTATNLVGLY